MGRFKIFPKRVLPDGAEVVLHTENDVPMDDYLAELLSNAST